MAEGRYTIERTNMISNLIGLHPSLTNAEIAESLFLPYRTVQLITCKLAKQGVIVGYVNNYGGVYSNVSWRMNQHYSRRHHSEEQAPTSCAEQVQDASV